MIRPGSASDPLWYKDAIVYQLHVKSFFDGNNDGIGDFAGLTEKLDYLQGLGVTCLWLLPFYPSPLRDDGYDIANYHGVHPSYGTLKDFKRFLREAHERGLQVITELVVNHTSDQHPWFQAARKAPAGSVKRQYYVWSETDRKYEGVRIIFTDSEKSNWSWDAEAGAYYWHRFFHHQPDLNFDNPHVRKAILRVMRFWLDIGVDGLRLDAVPYLIEREGTICENLPETHEVLKEIRRELDRTYANRMLLAEANQWPADVRAYFADGDESHMAFNFPLMPRMYMAVKQEDRHPITEIVSQTPDIPDLCQWAIFLRNHDELTLEMVTDEERDYMYQAYATDPQMRINVGIRRRLAPLLENNRRRVELLNSLLMSLPGTPIIYYGDELGMGDNVFLGDRNGVRTPMQWTGDRNAGFSRADPARLFAPVIMDPVYGYQAVNVEAQERSPFSLLQWMRRLIALRKRHKTFGRGTIEFLHPQNRKILAFVRRYDGERILVVGNLSRTVQPAELDLSHFNGTVPVEMLGQTEFPRIGELPYFLTLAPYGFYWFELRDAPLTPLVVRPTTPPERAEAPMPPLFVGEAWDTMFDTAVRHLVERRYLLPYLRRQRWFPAKSRTAQSAVIKEWAVLSPGKEPGFLLLVDVHFAEGAPESYFVPLAARSGASADELERRGPDRVVARITGARKGVLHEILEDRVAAALLDAFATARGVSSPRGTFVASKTSAFESIRGPAEPGTSLEARRSASEQSNTSLIYGDRLILKLIRRVEPGMNPELEIGRHLTERIGYGGVPRLAGGMEYRPRQGESMTLGVMHELIPHQWNAWEHALGQVEWYLEQVQSATDPLPWLVERAPRFLDAQDGPAEHIHEVLGPYLGFSRTLGRETAALHAALAEAAGDESFLPEPVTSEDLAGLADQMSKAAGRALATLGSAFHKLPDDLRPQADRALHEREQLIGRFRLLAASISDPASRIRIHGDYHLGQVLWSEGEPVILDFEGEPARSLATRRARQPALKDVAGLLRSLSYAAYAGLFSIQPVQPADLQRLDALAGCWSGWTSAAFLGAYRLATAGATFVPADEASFLALLDMYVLDKTFYELEYELNNRPDWVRIPLRGLLAILPDEDAT